jgi:ankyrin repeat protein
LIWAACKGEEKIVTLLLAKGAKTAARTKEEGYTALMQAAARGHENIVRWLLENGADVDAKNELDNTALIQAITNGHGAVVRVLLENNANIDIESKQRRLGFGPRMKAIDFARKNRGLRMLLKR